MATLNRPRLIGAVGLGLALLGAWAASEGFECAAPAEPAAAHEGAPDLSLPTQSELELEPGFPTEIPALTF